MFDKNILKKKLTLIIFTTTFFSSAKMVHMPSFEELQQRVRQFPCLDSVFLQKTDFLKTCADVDIESEDLMQKIKEVCYLRLIFCGELEGERITQRMRSKLISFFSEHAIDPQEEAVQRAFTSAVQLFNRSGKIQDFKRLGRNRFRREEHSLMIAAPENQYDQVAWLADVLALYNVFFWGG